jgi:hypothetical protein
MHTTRLERPISWRREWADVVVNEEVLLLCRVERGRGGGKGADVPLKGRQMGSLEGRSLLKQRGKGGEQRSLQAFWVGVSGRRTAHIYARTKLLQSRINITPHT